MSRPRLFRQLAFLAVLAALALGVGQAAARVDALDLGTRPTTGQQAVNGQPARNYAIVHAFACDDEMRFMDAFRSGREEAKDWPIGHLTAKAAYVSRASFPAVTALRSNSCSADEREPDYAGWRKVFESDNDIALWDEAQVDQKEEGDAKAAALAQAVTALYDARFEGACADAASHSSGTGVQFMLTPECLMRQIKVVLTHSNLGTWEGVGDNRTYLFPGTDKLPCINALPLNPLEGTKGDWDMAVLQYTRLAFLIYAAKQSREEVADEADAALDKLNRWLLTLRGGPATELYDLFWSCGNPANSYGSASDYVNDNDVYHEDMKRTVSGKDDSKPSFWKRLWRFLRILLVAAAVALALGLALGALVGLSGGVLGGVAFGATLLGAAIVVVVWQTVWLGGIEETENHLFMQNTSKYLKNKLMMAELRESGDRKGFDQVADENEDVREWLLKRMKRVVEEDFAEYNSKPYSRFSHQSILNLIDYACEVSWRWEAAAWPPSADRSCEAKDQAVVTGAAAVYDLSAAKLALGSNEGRRVIPFRRLVEANAQYRDEWRGGENEVFQPPRNFHDLFQNSDHLLAALQAWTAATQHAPHGRATRDSIGQMMWYATSRYVPHETILDLAVDKSTPIRQAYNHGGSEVYSSGPRWLLTAGGDDTRPAQGLRVNLLPFGAFGADVTLYWLPFINLPKKNDRGVGVPTTLMVTGASPRDTYRQLLRFEGEMKDWGMDGAKPLRSHSRNRCVLDNFACGLNLVVPPSIDESCLLPSDNPDAPAGLRFISSARCPDYQRASAGNDFFVAVFQRDDCRRCGYRNGMSIDYENWGFIEVVEASDFEGALELYQDMLIAANKPYFADWLKGSGLDKLRFYSMATKKRYEFTPADEDFGSDCRACGTVVNGSGAKFSIRNPRRPGQSIEIDYSDAMNPKREPRGGLIFANP